MIGALISLLVLLIVFGVLWYVFTALVPLPAPFAMLVRAVLALIFVLVVVGIFFGGWEPPFSRWRL